MSTLTAFLFVPATFLACLWVDGTTIDGHIHSVGGSMSVMRLREAMEESQNQLSAESKFHLDDSKAPSREAEAVNHVYQGNLPGALAILQNIETSQPGGYSTAANLGTVYELMGDNVNALKWINEGIRRNPDSHHGTEWLHALILEAKIDASSHPDHPLKTRIISLPERISKENEIQIRDKNYSGGAIREALLWQLAERMVFVKPKDPYVADLLYSMAILEANFGTVEAALTILDFARQYGFVDEPLLNQRVREYRSIIFRAKLIWWSPFVLGPVAFLFICHRKKWFFLTRKAYFAHQAALAAKARGQ